MTTTAPAAKTPPAAPTKAPAPPVVAKSAPPPQAKDIKCDRVQMLSLRNDGSAEQQNPELIGDEDDALARVRQQFLQQVAAAGEPEGVPDGLRANHVKVIKAITN